MSVAEREQHPRGRGFGRRPRRRHRVYSPRPLPSGPFAEPPALGFVAATWLVAKRDMIATLRSKGFIISAVTMLVAVLVAFVVVAATNGSFSALGRIGGDIEDDVEATPVAVVAGAGVMGEGIEGIALIEVSSEDEAEALVRSGEVEAAVLAPADPGRSVRVMGDDDVPTDLVDALTVTPEVTLLNPPRLEEMARYWLSLVFGVLYLMMGATFGQMIAQNTVIEKQTRIVEILLAVVPARAMLAGKILGGSILAVGETVLLVAASYAGMVANHMTALLGLLTVPMWWYVAFFLVGFVMYAAMFTAAGAMVTRTEDLASASTPILLLVMAPYILVLALNGSPTAMAVMSFVPFTSPVAMPVRLVMGDAGVWQAVAALALLAAMTVLLVIASAKIYMNSVLQMGSRVRLGQALRGGTHT
ncbi:MAG: ABC transporter permease [Bifidobacteriaceae bacterium]|jgi:ABC-2 type transport system permease protein|nr:ABC transporter permease [Bifidobacteriaceae bacterium]